MRTRHRGTDALKKCANYKLATRLCAASRDSATGMACERGREGDMCSMCVYTFVCVFVCKYTHAHAHAAICISPEAASTSNNLRAHERWCIMPPHTRIMGRIIDGAEEVDGINASCARVCARASVRMCICSSGAITQVSVCVCTRVCVRTRWALPLDRSAKNACGSMRFHWCVRGGRRRDATLRTERPAGSRARTHACTHDGWQA